MESQGTVNSQNNLEKEQTRGSHFLILKPTTELQQSKQCDTGTKTDIQTNGTE